jgi:hypothetical protein
MQYHQTAVVPRESILKTEVEWLHTIKADLVVWYHDQFDHWQLCCCCYSSLNMSGYFVY